VLAVLTLGAICGVAVGLYLHRDANPGCEPGRPSACTRVFFIGNSYTSVNDLPTTFADLAWSGGHRVETGVQAPGGWTLADHDSATSTDEALTGSKWNFVVLQEQSEIPSVQRLREANMYPAARDLIAKARSAGARPMFFLTWGHRNGWPAMSLPDYASMQSALDDGYLFIAAQQNAEVAPVGEAWRSLFDQESAPDLWQDDGSHPTEKGTYLAACVFYASIFLESPAGLEYHAGLSDMDASQAQNAAAATVLGDPSKWRLAVLVSG
jgi:Domain of unknown function (DUF4886)